MTVIIFARRKSKKRLCLSDDCAVIDVPIPTHRHTPPPSAKRSSIADSASSQGLNRSIKKGDEDPEAAKEGDDEATKPHFMSLSHRSKRAIFLD